MLIFQLDMRLLARGIRLSSKLIRSCVARGRRSPMNEARCVALPMRHIREGNRMRSTLVVLSALTAITLGTGPRRLPRWARRDGLSRVPSGSHGLLAKQAVASHRVAVGGLGVPAASSVSRSRTRKGFGQLFRTAFASAPDCSGAAQKSARQHGFTLANSLRPWCSSLFALQHIELPERQNGKR